MGATDAGFGLLLDTVSWVGNFVDVFLLVYTILIFVFVLSSWVRLPYSFNPVLRFLHDVCDPYLRLFRRFVPAIGAIDLSPMVAIISLYVIRRIIDDVILNRF
jgi:YggT family protein